MEEWENGVARVSYEEALKRAKAVGYTREQFDRRVKRQESNILKKLADTVEKLGLTGKVEVIENGEDVLFREGEAERAAIESYERMIGRADNQFKGTPIVYLF